MKDVLELYGLHKNESAIADYGSGLINNTWIVSNKRQEYIFQKINKEIFINPQLIDDNIHLIDNYLENYKPAYRFIMPLPSLEGATIVFYKDEYYRLFKLVPSKTFTVVEDIKVACEAAKQFGKFTKILSGFDAEKLNETIPDFHDLKLRYMQFLEALKHGDKQRIYQSEKIITSLEKHSKIVDVYNSILSNSSFKKRVTHHDTKISNVLFDENNKGIAVIDLDTVMSGYFISDVGDMLRTYLSPAGEEETNLDLIEVRDEYFKAVAKGYLSQMKTGLSSEEINAFLYAGKFMIYMQALRFISDYLNNDVYYKVNYTLHNFNRAQNQLHLLECLVEKEEYYQSVVYKICS